MSYNPLVNIGSALPINLSECGLDYTAGTNELNIIANQPASWRYQWWARLLMVGAVLGYKKWHTYTWDTPFSNYPDFDPNGMAKAINDVHVNVAGKTIKNAFYYVGGQVVLQFTDGTSFAV